MKTDEDTLAPPFVNCIFHLIWDYSVIVNSDFINSIRHIYILLIHVMGSAAAPPRTAPAGAVAPRAAVTHTQSRGPPRRPRDAPRSRRAGAALAGGAARPRGKSWTGVCGRGAWRAGRRSQRSSLPARWQTRLEVRFEGAVARCAARAWAAVAWLDRRVGCVERRYFPPFSHF